MKNRKDIDMINMIKKIINAGYADDDADSEKYDFGDDSDVSDDSDGAGAGADKYDNLKNYKKYIYNPNKYFCLIILVFIRKILIESDKKWYQKIINDDTDMDFSNIKLKLIKLLKTYIYYLVSTTYCLTNIKSLFDKYIIDIFDYSELSFDGGGGGSGSVSNDDFIYPINTKTDTLIKQEDITKSKSIYKLKKIVLKEIELNKKIKQIKKKLKNNLLQLYKINDYFEDKEHEYLLNSKMKPEIIRKIKDENNIEDVFNILKDILQLKYKKL